ncbi:retrovirus-related pol polyprotein from transposon TNT 1-94 [Tanacetum coccineum]
MTTLAEHIIMAGAENRPPMLEKSMYDSWESRIRLFIKGKKHGRMMLNSINNGPLVYPTIKEDGQIRLKKYSEPTEAQQLQDDCNVQATNIILHGLPPDVCALINHQEAAKDIWDKGKLLMKGTELSMTMQQVQVNTKFLNDLPLERSKFVTYVKLAKSLYTTNYDQLCAYLSLVVPKFYQGEYLIDCINKAMAFLSTVVSRFQPSNNQLRMSSNPINQVTIQDGRVIVQQILRRQTQSFAGTGNKGIPTTSRGNYAASQPRVVKCCNCQREGHMARQCTKPKRPRNSALFKEKLMLVEAQEAAFQTEDLDAYDSDCDDISSTKAILMENLSSCDSEVLFELNKIKEDVGKHFVTKKDMSAEQDFWLKHSNYNPATSVKSHTPVRIKAPSELPKSQEKDTVIRKLKDRIKSLSGKDSVENVKKDIDEIETINIELEHSVAKLLSENENLRKEREHLKSIYKDQFDSIKKTRVQSKEHCASLIAQINPKSVENSDLNAQLQEKVFAIAALKNELKKLKGKNVLNTVVSKPIATIAPGMFKLYIEPIHHRLKNNMDAHEVYLEKIIENTDTLCGLVECARKQNPSELLLESACMFTKHVQELLVYVSKTCPSLTKPCEKLVTVTPRNKDKKVRFVEPVTSSSNIPKQTDSLRTKDYNKPLLTSTKVNTTTNASGSKPSGNTKKNRISRPPSSNQKNKVEEHTRKVKFGLNKMNSATEPISKVFTEIGYSWKPTGRIFTIVGNRCPLTRITSNKEVPLKESTITPVIIPFLELKSRGSTVFDVPSSSLNDCKLSKLFGNDHIAKIMGYGDYQMGNVTISWVYYVEGLGHNLFSMGQFCDSDLEVAFIKHTCFIRDLYGVDLLKGLRGSNLYTLSMENLFLSSPICLLSKASKTKSWLWHRRLSHLNFDYITSLAKQGLV